MNIICNLLANFNFYKKEQNINLPDEMWITIIENLNPIDLIKGSMVSKKFYQLFLDEKIWRDLSRRSGLDLTLLEKSYGKTSFVYRLVFSSLSNWQSFPEKSFVLDCADGSCSFKLKIIPLKKEKKFHIYYSSLSKLTKESPSKVPLEPSPAFIDYVMRLVRGDVCGLYINSAEDKKYSITLKD